MNNTTWRSRWQGGLAHGAVLLLAAAVILSALLFAHGQHIWQSLAIAHWEDALFFQYVAERALTPATCFTQPNLWPGLYRPLTTNCYYAVGGQLFDQQVAIYKTINVVVYGFNALLLSWITRLLVAWPYALLAGVLFASRQAHAEVVTNTVEFQVLAAVGFALLALLFFIQAVKRQQWFLTLPSALCLALALLSKEVTITLLLLLLIYLWLFAPQFDWHYLLPPVIVVALWSLAMTTFIRTVIMDAQPTGFHFTFAPAVILQNGAAHLWSFADAVIWVADDENVIMPEPLLQVASSTGGQAALSGLLLVTVLLLAYQKRLSLPLRVFALGAAFFGVGVLPFLFFEDRLFMRYGYFAHAGLSMALAGLAAEVGARFTAMFTNTRSQGYGASAAL